MEGWQVPPAMFLRSFRSFSYREKREPMEGWNVLPALLASGVLGPSLSKRKANPERKRNRETREGMDGTCCLVCCLQKLKIVLTQNKRENVFFIKYSINIIYYYYYY
jgi:hypothetical protein